MIPALLLALAGAPTPGVAGVCIRWGGDDLLHPLEAVVVDPSGDASLDAGLPAAIIKMRWPAPGGYEGGKWMAAIMAVSGTADTAPKPNCDSLPDKSGG